MALLGDLAGGSLLHFSLVKIVFIYQNETFFLSPKCCPLILCFFAIGDTEPQ